MELFPHLQNESDITTCGIAVRIRVDIETAWHNPSTYSGASLLADLMIIILVTIREQLTLPYKKQIPKPIGSKDFLLLLYQVPKGKLEACSSTEKS